MAEQKPSTYADLRLATGEQGSGKSNSIVALATDDYHAHLTHIMSPSGELISAKPIDQNDKMILRRAGIYPNKLKYVRILSDDGKQTKLIRIPAGYMVISPVHIFANFHLYGIKYAYITLEDIVQHINDDLFDDAWVLSDESVMTDARNSMEAMGKIVAMFGGTIRKRRMHFCQAAQFNEMVERRFRLFATTKILCSYDEDTRRITLDIKKRGEDSYTTDYYAPNYWPYFETEEKILVPQHKLDKALAALHRER